MPWKSVKELSFGGKSLNFCYPVPTEWTWKYNSTTFTILNNVTNYKYKNSSEEEVTFESWLYGNPKAFSIGEWLKENLTVGANEDLLILPSGYRFNVNCYDVTNSAGQFCLYRPDGTIFVSIANYGVNGGTVGSRKIIVNASIVLWINSETKKAIIQYASASGTRFTDSWNGSIYLPDTMIKGWTEAQQEELFNAIQGILPPDFYDDTSTTGGGDGDWYDDSSDTIGLPDLTTLNQNSISNTKFLTCYKMTQAQLSKLGDELWSENFFHQISNSVLKPTDFIVNLSLLPVDVGGVTKYIKAGKIYLNGTEGTVISQQFIRVDCGTLEVKKKWGGAIDYQTDVSIFLPFIGEQSLNANEVMGAALNVIYTVDILSGSCIASIRVIKDNLDAVLYQFTGNMASNYPITSADYSTVFAATLQVAIGETNIGNAGGVLSMVSATSNLLRGPEVKRTGSLSSASGFMGIKKPYLILSRPVQSLAESYNHFNGFVSNIKMKLGDCCGFTKIDMVHLEAIPCMDEEKAEIESLLKSGVLIN